MRDANFVYFLMEPSLVNLFTFIRQNNSDLALLVHKGWRTVHFVERRGKLDAAACKILRCFDKFVPFKPFFQSRISHAVCAVLAFEYMHSKVVRSMYSWWILDSIFLKSIIYRDLKPENILLNDKVSALFFWFLFLNSFCSQGMVKITDFGFAKKVKDRLFLSFFVFFCVFTFYVPLYPALTLFVALLIIWRLRLVIVHRKCWIILSFNSLVFFVKVSNQGHGVGADWWTLGVLLFEMLAGLYILGNVSFRMISSTR